MFETSWSGYAYPEINTVTRTDEMKQLLSAVPIKSEKFNACGIPLIVRDGIAYVNNETENVIVYGETGSKKSRCAISPLIVMTAGAEESAIITDVKGELYENINLRGYLESKWKVICMDFRKFDKDSYNILEPAYLLYKSGKKSKASAMVHRFIDSLGARHRDSKADPFWDTNACQVLIAITMFLFEICATSNNDSYDKYVNISTVATLISDTERLKVILDEYFPNLNNGVMTALRNYAELGDRTLSCVRSTATSMLQDFMQEHLTNMLSSSSFNIDKMYEQPTFLFLIVPDETTAYQTISGLMIDIFYSRLIEVYTEKYQGRRESPCRINIISDEFCNLKINDMKAKISASRSRNMRWFLVCQSKSQLESAYPNDASTILGNCKNTLFLQSSDTNMLEYISNLCGKTLITEMGTKANLISEEVLKGLKKTYVYKEALFIRDNLKYFASLPDIEGWYILLEKYNANPPEIREHPKASVYTFYKLEQDLEYKRVRPYSDV